MTTLRSTTFRLILRGVRLFDAAAEDWLGFDLPPADRTLARAEFTPDQASDYCSRCGDSVGPGEAGADGCASCRSGPGLADGVVRLGAYADDLRQWLLAIKYDARWSEMARRLGSLLGAAIEARGVIELERAVVVPMPMPWPRRLYRGIDHARAIAGGVARHLHAPLVPMLVKANGPPQVTLTMTERRRLGGRGMRLRRRLGGWPLDGCDVVLVDDVRTTGASLRAATRLVRSARPRRILAAVVAVSDSPSRRSKDAQAHKSISI